METHKLKYYESDIGYCRVYWKLGRQLYCVQEEYKGVYDLLICTPDGEPCTSVPIGSKVFEPIPDPTPYEQGFMEYLRGHGALLEGSTVQ